MKIAVSGKGGTGKTTLAGILAHLFKDDGYRVLAVDADPDANLASAVGIPPELALSIKPISEQRRLIKERTGANPRQFGQLFKLNPTVSDIPDDFSVDFEGIKLLVMGSVRKGGEGCACPENVLLKNLLSEILLERKEAVIVDMEAGIEHLGRATARSIDRMLIVVEPGTRSIETAKKIITLGKEIGLQDFGIIGNKLLDKHQQEWIEKHFEQNVIFGMIPFDQNILKADQQQKSPFSFLGEDSKAEFSKIYSRIKH